jgi:hypothetical protein
MRKQKVKRLRGAVGGGSTSIRVMCLTGVGSATEVKGKAVVCAVAQRAQSGCEEVPAKWL